MYVLESRKQKLMMKISLQSRSPWLENLENIKRSEEVNLVCGDGGSEIFPASFLVASSEFLQSVLASCTSCSVSSTIYLPSLAAPTLKLLHQILIGGETEQLSGDEIENCLANVEEVIDLLGCKVRLVTKLSSSKVGKHQAMNISSPACEASLVKEELEIMVVVKDEKKESESRDCEKMSAVISKTPRSRSGKLVTLEAEKRNCDLNKNIFIPENVQSQVPASHNLQSNVTISTMRSALPVSLVTGVPVLLPSKPLPKSQVFNLQPCHPTPGIRYALKASPSQPAVSLRVQSLIISNAEPHPLICLSLLKATYEPCHGKAIEQIMMYKQYVASMHRVGRSIAVSDQHFHVICIGAFGASIGPFRNIYYKGIQLRAQPLPLKQILKQEILALKARREPN